MPAAKASKSAKPTLLTGGNPQIAKADRAKAGFLSLHCYTKYVKVAFFRGTSLRPVPPGESKQKGVRYFDIHEDDRLDETQLTAWIKQAAAIPGWDGGSSR